jgi:starch synthase (maltosyl-transferring)
VGSPWAIGSSEGGHLAIEPSLGTDADFDRFVARARELGMEVALDYALQCSPDHPWVAEHPEWFRRRPDGTIRYAENPPKRYQDIYPLEFWPPEPHRTELWTACREVLEHWIARGVRVFRVDNPHTKAVAFWEWVIPAIWSRTPDVVFLAEAFTRPAMMHRLAELGFSQSYTYFTWRDEPWEVREYLEELVRGPDSQTFRPNFWPTTPDILAGPLRGGNRAAFQLRAVLAALTVPSWGVYSGYELMENVPASPDNEEFADSEKYRVVERDWSEPGSLAPFITMLNETRRSEPAFADLHDLTFHHSENDRILAWSKGRVLVVANFDTERAQETTVWVDLGALGLGGDASYRMVDLLDGGTAYEWQGSGNYVRLDPSRQVAHAFRVEPAEGC